MKKLLTSLVAVSMILAGCSSTPKEETKTEGSKVVTLEGTGQGIHGDVKVSVELDGDKITKVEVTEHSETPDIGTKAVDEIPGKIVEANSTDVDNVSGATITSDAIKDAVKDALSKK